jgi:hypothetical protein
MLESLNAAKELKNYTFEHKLRLVIGLTMFHVLKDFLDLADDNKLLPEIKSKYVKIAQKCDLRDLDVFSDKAFSHNSIMMIIFIKYIQWRWNRNNISKGELLSCMAVILVIGKVEKMDFDKGLFSMLIHLFTSSYVNVSIKGNYLLEDSSCTIMKYIPHLKIVKDINFLKWWHCQNVLNKTKDLRTYESSIIGFINLPINNLDNLTCNDLSPFNLKLMIDWFFDTNKDNIINKKNLAKLIDKFPLSIREYEKFLRRFQQSLDKTKYVENTDVLSILSSNAVRLNIHLKKRTGKLTLKTLKNPNIELCDRMMKIQLAVSIMKKKTNKKIKLEGTQR